MSRQATSSAYPGGVGASRVGVPNASLQRWDESNNPCHAGERHPQCT